MQVLRCELVSEFLRHDCLRLTLGQEAQRIHGDDPNWRVGTSGITKEDVILIGVVHVSQGSWQPILQLNRFVLSRSIHLPWLQ